MNRNYKVIWNASLNCFMAVSEYAKARGKSSKSSVSSNATINTTSNLSSTSAFKLTAIGLGLVAAGLMSPQVFAATGYAGGTGSGTAASKCTSSATQAKAIGDYSVAIGCNSEAGDDFTLIDRLNPNYPRGDIPNTSSVAIGSGAVAKDVATAIGSQARAEGRSSVALGVAAYSTGNTSLAIGRQSAATEDFAQAIGNVSSATGKGSLAIGHSALASGKRGIAIGSTKVSKKEYAGQVGVGYEAAGQTEASGVDSIAFGSGAKATVDKSMALGEGANVNHTGSVALGSGSIANGSNLTTAAFQPLDSNGSPIVVAAPTAKSEVSVGNVNEERRITNLAAGAMDTDAVNVSQLRGLSDTVAANKTKYYSVNSSGGTNDLNEGATGQNAMAMGRNSVASGSQAISIGSGASGQKTTASGEQSIAIGANSVSKGASSIAIGGDDLDAASKANTDGTSVSALNGGSVNTTFKAYTGRDLVETPPYNVNTESGGAASIAMGAKALSQGALSTAIGIQSSSAGIASSAFGAGSSASQEGSVALGAGSVASVAGGAVGYVPVGVSAADALAITNTQSGASFGAVSVGTSAKGGNRQIVNLAAGTADSDAVNVAQLKGGISSVVDKGFGLKAVDGNTVMKQLGDQVEVVGSNSNITTKVAGGQIAVVLNDNLDLGASGSVKMGTSSLFGLGPVTTVDRLGVRTGNALANTNINGLGVFVNGPLGIPSTTLTIDGLNIIGGPSVTRSGGIDAGNRRITRVSNGINPTDAVNLSQLTGVAAGSRTEVIAGTNVAVTNNPGTNGQNVYTIDADGTTASAGSAAVTVTPGTKATDNLTDYAVDLSQGTKDSLDKADNSVQYDNPAQTNVTLGGAGATASVSLTNIAAGDLSAISTDAVNGSQLFETNTKVDRGFGLKAADGNTVMKQLGDQVEVVGSNSNITTKVINGKIAVDLNNKLDLGKSGSVKMGNSSPLGFGAVTTVDSLGLRTGSLLATTDINGLGVFVNGPLGIPSTTLTVDGLNIVNGPSVTRSGGIDAGGQQITNVASGGTTTTNAANIGDVKSAAAANKTKYYSVNSSGGTNDLNEGATGQNAMAMGRNSVASGSQAISIGSSASGQKTTASGEQSIAIGANSVSKGASSIAIGGDDLDAASKANTDGTSVSALNGGSVNTTFKAYTGRDLVETPPYNVNTESGGAASIAMGAKALSQGALSTAIGIQSSSAGVASSAFGVGSSASKDGSVALGAGSTTVSNATKELTMSVGGSTYNVAGAAQAAGDQVSIGSSGRERQIKHVASGAVNASSTDAINGSQLHATNTAVNKNSADIGLGIDFTGDNTATTVNRKLGEKLVVRGGATTALSDNNIGVEATSPDTLTVKLAKDLTGLDSVTTGNTVMNTNGLRVGNSLVNQNGFTFQSTGSPNNTVRLTEAGLHNGNQQITGVLSGGTTPTNAANIGDVKSAAAGSKTEVVKGTNVTSVNKTTGSNGQDIYTVNANGTTTSAGSAAVSVTPGTKDSDNVTDYKVDLSDVTKTSLSSADSALQSVVTQIDGVAVKTITKANNTANFLKGDNILLTDENGDIKVALAKNVNLGPTGSVTTGNTVMNTGGVTFLGGSTVKLSGTGLNNGGNQITGVGPGILGTDAVNVNQLTATTFIMDKGLNFGGDSGTDVNRKLGQKLIVKGGDTINADPATKNISVMANGEDTLTVRLAKDINLGNTGSVTTGNTQVNNTGITLYNGDNGQVVLTNNGLNNGNNKITNVAAGMLSADSKDAVNGSQLFKTNENIAKGIKFDLNGATKTYALGEAIQVATDANITTTAFGNGAKFGLADTIKIGGTSVNAISIDGTSGIVKGLTNTTFDASTTYTGGQAATQEQLSGLQSGINSTFDKGISFGGDSGTDVKRKLGEKIIVKGGVSDPTKLTDSNIGVSADGTDTLTVKLAKDLTGLNSASFGNDVMISSIGLRAGATLINTGGVSFTDSGVKLNSTGFTITNNVAAKTVSLTGTGLNNGGNVITNVARGEAATDAVNVGQLNEVKQNAADANKGWNVSAQGANTSTVKPSDTVDLNNTDNNITVSKTAESNNVSFNLSKNITVDSIKTGDATLNSDGLTIAGGPRFTKTNVDAAGNKITNVANGAIEVNSKDAVNGSQLFEFVSLVNTQTTAIAEMGAGLNFDADTGPVINKKGGSNPLSFKGGNNITTTAEGSSIKFDLNGNINVDSVTTGNTTVNNSGVIIKNGPSMTAAGVYAGNAGTAPSMTAAGINAAGTKVTNVADGMAPRDAVNFGQLDAVSRGLGNSINELGYKIGEVEDDANAGISAAMAMSSLPQAYIIGKPLIGGGIATYNGESAVAIGFSKMSNDGRWVMKLNGTADTQGNVGAAIGAGFHFD